jgi:nitrogen regulatory protein PII
MKLTQNIVRPNTIDNVREAMETFSSSRATVRVAFPRGWRG